jgi:hypothetical protein
MAASCSPNRLTRQGVTVERRERSVFQMLRPGIDFEGRGDATTIAELAPWKP